MFKYQNEEIGEVRARELLQQSGYGGVNKLITQMTGSDEPVSANVEDGLLTWYPDSEAARVENEPGLYEGDAYSLIRQERQRQDIQWGGSERDDTNTPDDWLGFINKQLSYAQLSTPEGYRERMLKVAALAVAAYESQMRLMP